MDPDSHSFSLLDPDPGRGKFEGKNRKTAEKWKKMVVFYNIIITKCGQTPLYITFKHFFVVYFNPSKVPVPN